MPWLSTLPVRVRRAAMAALVLSTVVLVTAWIAALLAADGLALADVGMIVLLAVTAAMVALSFWSSLVGALLLRGGDPPSAVAPPCGDAPITSRVAILMPICDEVPEDVFERLQSMQDALDGEPSAGRFEYFVLSDTRDRTLAEREERLVRAWRRADPEASRLHYRRRSDNPGFKAGNVFDFCVRHGARFELMVILDADSLMSGDLIRRLVRTMEARPEIGILQPLIVGLPTPSAFARIFQFGMRHGMRAYATGCAWWQADEGSFWGHNAAVRIRPFLRHCQLPEIQGRGPLSGSVLSHDQLEAVLMRAGGYEVRVLPVEDGSLEQNPPTLPDFVTRDLRWCQGNMQYLKLLGLPGLRPLGRVQLLLAIMLFLASPMWLGFLTLGLAQAVIGGADGFVAGIDPALGIGLFALMMTMSLAPKLIGIVEALLSERRSASYGGRGRLLAGAGLETLFSILLGPIMAVTHTIFIVGLLLGRRIRWQAQRRTERRIALGQALGEFWPQTVLGLGAAALLALHAPALLPWAAPVLLGLILAAPFASLTSDPLLGGWLVRTGLCASPEELAGQRRPRLQPNPSGEAAQALGRAAETTAS